MMSAGPLKPLPQQDVSDFLIRELMRRMEAKEPFACFILSQAYLEAALNGLLSSALFDPDEMGLEAMSYKRKLDLAVALGLIHKEAKSVYMAFAIVRNRFAHQQTPEWNDKLERDFLNVLRKFKPMRDSFRKARQFDRDIQKAIWAMWLYFFVQSCKLGRKMKNLNGLWRSMVHAKHVPRRGVSLGLKFVRASL